MKKIVLVLVMIAVAVTMQAQSQLKTVRGKTKDGKTVSVQYYQGTIEDNIVSVKYQVVDDLEARIKTLQSDVRDLQNKLNNANNQVKQLENQVQVKDNENKNGNDALWQELQEKKDEVVLLNSQIEHLNGQLKQLNDEKAALQMQLDSISAVKYSKQEKEKCKTTPIVGVEISAGPVLYNNTVNEQWRNGFGLNKQIAAYFGTARLMESFPLSIEAGIDVRSFALTAAREGYEKTIEGLVDADGHSYDAFYTYSNLNEKLSLAYLGIPIRICFGQPVKNRISVYAKLGVTPSFRISNKFEGEGTYTLKGHYSAWDLTFTDIEELGFVSEAPCYADGIMPATKPFVLWGNVALGACIPFGESPVQMNFGVKVDYSFTALGSAEEVGTLTDGAGLLNKGGKVLIPSFSLGLIYTLK